MKCPHCGGEVSGECCDYCGSELKKDPQPIIHITNNYYGTPAPEEKQDDSPNVTQKPNKKLVWWILGWIFIFPLPLTVLLMRNKNMSPWLKYSIVAAVWIVWLTIGVFGGTESYETPTDVPAFSVSQEVSG